MTEGVRISDLTAAAALTGAEELPVVQSSATVKATADQVALYAKEYASRVRSVSADYTITGRTDSPIVQVTAGATDRTITLPDGSTLTPGDEFEVVKVDSGAGKVTVSRAATDTIDGVTSVDVDSQYDLVRVRWSGTYWTIVEYKDHKHSNTITNSNNRAEVSFDRRADGSVDVSIWWSFVGGGSSTQDLTVPLGITLAEYRGMSGVAIGAEGATTTPWVDIEDATQLAADVIASMYAQTLSQVVVRASRPSGASFSSTAVYGVSYTITARWRA
jgi:hypothetical protein